MSISLIRIACVTPLANRLNFYFNSIFCLFLAASSVGINKMLYLNLKGYLCVCVNIHKLQGTNIISKHSYECEANFIVLLRQSLALTSTQDGVHNSINSAE